MVVIFWIFFTVMLWAASIELLLGLVAYLSSCWKTFGMPKYTVWAWAFSGCHNYDLLEVIERFLYDLEMKMHEQNRNNKQMGIEWFDWFIEQIQTLVAFGWLSERTGEKT